MKGKKIGLLALALVLALGALGVGYAAWTDTIIINGTVSTGDVDLEIVELSWMEVWKDFDDDSAKMVAYIDTDCDLDADIVGGTVPTNGELFAYTEWTAVDVDADTATCNFENVIPYQIPFVVDIVLHCEGNIPVKLNEITLESTGGQDWVQTAIDDGYIYWEAQYIDLATRAYGPQAGVGSQLEYCECVIIEIRFNVPQLDEYQGLTNGGFTLTVDAVQWNEYPYNP